MSFLFMKYIILLAIIIMSMMLPVIADETYTITFTGYEDGKIKIMYQEANATGYQTMTIPKDNEYNRMITEYISKFKLFN